MPYTRYTRQRAVKRRDRASAPDDIVRWVSVVKIVYLDDINEIVRFYAYFFRTSLSGLRLGVIVVDIRLFFLCSSASSNQISCNEGTA